MCGRFTQTNKLEELQRRFNAVIQKLTRVFKPSFNLAPGQSAPVVRKSEREAHIQLMQWGLIPTWAKEAAIGYKMINARSESLTEKPAYKGLVQRKRCLVPADGFFEWQKRPGGKQKIPWYFHLASREPFAFAGLWEQWEPEGGAFVESFTIITTTANACVQPVHDRMPVILSKSHEEAWLDPDYDIKPHLASILVPHPAEAMAKYTVSSIVNKPSNNSPACVEPADIAPTEVQGDLFGL